MTVIEKFRAPLLILFSLILTYYSPIISAEPINNPQTVNYTIAGKVVTILGEQNGQSYRFSKDSHKVVDLSTLHWPPYISQHNCNKGWVFNFTVALLVSQGYQVNVNFYPWARSLMLVEKGRMDILFPEYFIDSESPSSIIPTKKRRELLALSHAFPGGDLSLATHHENPINAARDLSLLQSKLVGVVRGYTNTPEVDQMIVDKVFSVIEAVDELQLVKLLAAKRVDYIIGDRTAFYHSVHGSPLLIEQKDALLAQVKYLTPALDEKKLYFAVSKKRPQWQTLLNDLNVGINQFKNSGLIELFINQKVDCPIDQPLTQ